jgi:hypothetical protein
VLLRERLSSWICELCLLPKWAGEVYRGVVYAIGFAIGTGFAAGFLERRAFDA